MFIRPLEAGPDVGVAPGTLFVDFRRLARYEAMRSVLVNRMARRAAHLVFGMTAINAAHVGGLVQMAGEAALVGSGRLQLGRLDDVGGAHGFGVLAARSMA